MNTLGKTKSKNTAKLALAVVFFLLCAVGTFQLGQWQTRRGDEKQALGAKLTLAQAQSPTMQIASSINLTEWAFRRVVLKGEFLPDSWVLLDNRQVQGHPAVQLIQAFRVLPEGFLVAVDRGFLLRNPSKPRDLPAGIMELITSSAAPSLVGIVLPQFPRSAELWGLRVGSAERIHQEGRLWSNFDKAQFFASKSGPLANFVVQQLSDEESAGNEPSLTENTLPPSAFREGVLIRVPPHFERQVLKHRGYAVQWYGITAALVLLTAVFVWRGVSKLGSADEL
jgi:cytochrome oxidase assembly protein ShyY1